ncbi:MAG: sulfate/molybdate ABC transporter ATP-binding protein [Syntrophales bacterium]
MSIVVENISKSFGAFHALRNVSLTVETGELLALLGPSGCGKTTLLRIIAGLEVPDQGAVQLNGHDTARQTARERKVGFVFQHYALFRHMTVFENVAYGLRVKPRAERPSEKEIHERVMELLKMVQLDFLADRYPSQLSGGQRQRVALSRALAVEPQVLLLDEPFGALDARVRRELRRWLRRLHDKIHVTSVFVTHDQEEALEVSDRVVVMNGGRIEQVGPPAEVYEHPATPFVFDFLGNVNLFRGRAENGKADLGHLTVDLPETSSSDPHDVVAYVRPFHFALDQEPVDPTSFPATLQYFHSVGPLVNVELANESGQLVQVQVSLERFEELQLQKGALIFLTPRKMQIFPDKQPKRL